MLTLNHRLQPREEEIAAKVIDGETIMINLANGVYYSMDKVGALIWEMIEGKHTLEKMIATIHARYDVSREQVQTDIERLVAELLRENLVALSDNSGTTDGKRETE